LEWSGLFLLVLLLVFVRLLSPFTRCSSPLLAPVFASCRFLLCGEEAAAWFASSLALVYWLLPSFLVFLPAPFLCDTFSGAVFAGGLAG
jgi:hypothetical protein